MKRFLLFGAPVYYPGGGWDDFVRAFGTLKGAKAYVRENREPGDKMDALAKWQIVDLEADVENAVVASHRDEHE